MPTGDEGCRMTFRHNSILGYPVNRSSVTISSVTVSSVLETDGSDLAVIRLIFSNSGSESRTVDVSIDADFHLPGVPFTPVESLSLRRSPQVIDGDTFWLSTGILSR
jgi:hypothetical protein